MNAVDRKQAFRSPESEFRFPHAVVHCGALSHDEKLTVLRNWKQEIVQLQRAAEENMIDERGSADVATRLADVTQAMIDLKGMPNS
jgi:hypothetical protein